MSASTADSMNRRSKINAGTAGGLAGFGNHGPGDGRHGFSQLIHPRAIGAGDYRLPARPKSARGAAQAGQELSPDHQSRGESKAAAQ